MADEQRKNCGYEKGQVLIITAVIVVLVLFLIKTESTYIGSYDFSDTNNVNAFDNIKNELKRAGEITVWKDNYSSVYDFSDFLKGEKNTELFYSIADFGGTNLNITVVNFLDEAIESINITQNLTDEEDSISSINKGGSDYVNFVWSPGSETVFEVNVTYKGSSSGNVTKQIFVARAGPLRYVTVFYDLKFSYDDSYIEDRFSISGKRES